MSTSELPGPALTTPVSPGDDQALSLAKEIERLRQPVLLGRPGPGGERAAGDHAFASGRRADAHRAAESGAERARRVGAGGASPAVTAPPVPGWLHRPPLAAAPPPKESDLRDRARDVRGRHALGTTPLALAGGAPDASQSTPYSSCSSRVFRSRRRRGSRLRQRRGSRPLPRRRPPLHRSPAPASPSVVPTSPSAPLAYDFFSLPQVVLPARQTSLRPFSTRTPSDATSRSSVSGCTAASSYGSTTPPRRRSPGVSSSVLA